MVRFLLITCFFSRLLVRYPKILAKVRKDIDSAVGPSTTVTREDLKKMKYLSNVIKESQILSPPPPPFMSWTKQRH